MNESAIEARNLTRSILVAGEMRGTYDILHKRQIDSEPDTRRERGTYLEAVQMFRNLTASSGGRSTMIYPFAPAS